MSKEKYRPHSCWKRNCFLFSLWNYNWSTGLKHGGGTLPQIPPPSHVFMYILPGYYHMCIFCIIVIVTYSQFFESFLLCLTQNNMHFPCYCIFIIIIFNAIRSECSTIYLTNSVLGSSYKLLTIINTAAINICVCVSFLIMDYFLRMNSQV